MTALAELAAEPNALAHHYSRFRVSERLLLTGHSHQAWPDVACAGLVQAFDDAAEAVDDKWDRAMAKADEVRAGYRRLLSDLPATATGGFLALCSPHAQQLQQALRDRGVSTDSRGRFLRLGPAPYLSDAQMEDAIAALGDAVTGLGGPSR